MGNSFGVKSRHLESHAGSRCAHLAPVEVRNAPSPLPRWIIWRKIIQHMFPNHQCSLLFGEIIWRLSKAFVMCILLLCWTYSTDEDFNTPVVLQKSMVCDLNIRLAFGIIGHPAGHIACRNSNGWNTLQEKPIWLLSWLRPCTLAESLTSFTMNNPNIGSRTTWT